MLVSERRRLLSAKKRRTAPLQCKLLYFASRTLGLAHSDESVSRQEKPAWSSLIPGEKNVGHAATCACDRRRAGPDPQLPSDARLADSIPGASYKESIPDTLLFLNGRTNSSRWLPNSCFNSAIEIQSVRKDVSILGQRTASRRSISSLPAPVAVFLASEASFWITGEIILASGGMR